MAGPGLGEARLTLEAGSSRFVVMARHTKGPVTTTTLQAVLPQLESQMSDVLERALRRAERANQEDSAGSHAGDPGAKRP